MNEPIEIETTAVAVREQTPLPVQASLFGTTEPVAVIGKATAVADALRAVIEKQGLVSSISGKKYPRCEAWTLLGTMLGVFPVLQWTRSVEGGWEARVEAKTASGQIVGAAEAECLRSEKNWANRDDFALRSMAQTRATAKALRMPLGFVMTLSGFEATPAEEMVSEHDQPKRLARPEPKSSNAQKPLAERINGLKHKLGPVAGHALDYLRSHATDRNDQQSALLPNETLDDLSEAQVDFLAKNYSAFLTWLQAWVDQVDQVPGAEVAPKTAPAKPAGISNNKATGKIEYVAVKEGKQKNGQPYTRYGIKIDGTYYNTFSASIGEAAEDLKGETATVEFTEDDYGKKAVAITDETGNTVTSEDE